MIGKPEWFKPRKYTGWGLTPATWQGWLYTLVLVLPIILLGSLQTIGKVQMTIIIVWLIIACLDFIDIAIHMPKDERDRIHEAVAERNALWVIVVVLGTGIAFQSASAVVSHVATKVDPVIIIALFAGLIAKIISNIYLDKKD